MSLPLKNSSSLLANLSVSSCLPQGEGPNRSWAGPVVAPSQVAVGVLLTLIDLVTFLGNTVVFVCPIVERRLRTVTYTFIMSLAMADLLVACLVMPFSIIYEVTGLWQFGQPFCKMWISFDVLFCTASIVTLCFISLDRYCSVISPHHYPQRMSRSRCVAMTVTIWVYSSLISFLPVMQGWNEIPGVAFDDEGRRDCVFVTNRAFAIVASSLAFYLPFLITCTMYFFIYRASRLKARRVGSQALELHYHPESRRPDRLQLENKATRTMAVIVSVFVMCWLPYFVLNVGLAAGGWGGARPPPAAVAQLFKVITWLGYCNSAVNPVLYAFLNRDFQRALRRLLVWRGRGRRQSSCVDGGGGGDMVSIVTFSRTAQEAQELGSKAAAATSNGGPRSQQQPPPRRSPTEPPAAPLRWMPIEWTPPCALKLLSPVTEAGRLPRSPS